MLKAVLFDLNGIFIVSPKLSDRFEKDFGIQSEEFLPKLNEIMDKVRRPGAGKAFDYWQPVLVKWNIKLAEREFWGYWFNSDNFKERASYYEHYPWLYEAVDKTYFSWITGLIKPDVKVWEQVLNDNNLKPQECLYFDDQEKNITAAERVGIKSYKYKNPQDAKEILMQYF